MLKNVQKANHKVKHKIGTWRSLEAHLNGVQGVASSNLAVPTSKYQNYPLFTALGKSSIYLSLCSMLNLWPEGNLKDEKLYETLWFFNHEVSVFWESRKNHCTCTRCNKFFRQCSANYLEEL